MRIRLFGVALALVSIWAAWSALGDRGLPRTAIGVEPATRLAEAGKAAERIRPEAPFGLEKRTLWTTSNFRGRPEPPPPFKVVPRFPKLSFKETVLVATTPGSNRVFVGERPGKIYSIVDQADLFLDTNVLAERLNEKSEKPLELESLYGLTFDPNFAQNRYCYVCYVIRHRDRSKHAEGTRVSRFRVSATEPPVCEVESEKLIISWLQGGHNGGCLKFGPDGYLYVSSGDGGNAFPPDGLKSGQDLSRLLSKVMRIDVHPKSSDKPYEIPADNPFVALDKARGETWCYGLRNPWKMSFDRQTGDLWIGDVGWELWELVFRVNKGDNYGWSIVEGRQPVHTEGQRGPTPIVPATIEIPHTEGASVTGGFVYRGKQFPELYGHYVFGDWETRRVWSVPTDGGKLGERTELIDPLVRIVDFAEDAAGELYLLDHDSGAVFMLMRNEIPKGENRFPRKLSDTGLFESVREHRVAAGVLAFSINAPQWSDHAISERFLAIPGRESIKLRPKPKVVEGSQFSRAMDYPLDTVVMKTLSLDLVQGDPNSRRRIETQVLHYDGREFQAYTYEWNEQQTDATLVDRMGKSRTLVVADPQAPGGKRAQTWWFASRMECIRCHNPWSEYTLAFNVSQLNRRHEFGGTSDNQIRTYRHIGLIEDLPEEIDPNDPYAKVVPPKTEDELPHLSDPYDATADLNQRARSYMHVNCAFCHRFNGGGSAYIYLQHELPLKDVKALGVRPTQGTFGIHEAQILAPGDPYRSVMYFRLAKTGPGHMPHLGSKLIDERGLALMHDWIRQLPVRFDDVNKIEQLIALDEPAAEALEKEEGLHNRWLLAKRIAVKAGREKPGEADLKAAEVQYTEQLAKKVESRAATRPRLIKDLLATLPQAMLLAAAVRENRLPESIRAMVMEAALSTSDLAIRDLFEPFVPEEKRTKRLGESIAAGEILKLPGDAARGRELFHTSTVVQCRNCHRLENNGTELGSDLSQIGKKYDRAKILENILQPSLNIDPKYIPWLIETTSGKVYSGLLMKKDDKEVIIKDAERKEHRIAAADVEGMYPQSKSIMPDLLLRDFTAEQVADLLAYLSSLK